MRNHFALILLTLLGSDEPVAGHKDGEAGPNGWRTYAARTEIAPAFRVEAAGGKPGDDSYQLGLAGRGDDAVDGRWVREVSVRPLAYYTFSSEFLARDVESPQRSVLARVVWLDDRSQIVETPEYPVASLHAPGNGWSALTGTYRAPAKATHARLELHLRWAARGDVLWRGTNLRESPPPGQRKVRLATINHRPRSTRSARENLDQFARLVEEAARQKADIVCLPEAVTLVGNGKSFSDVGETIPGDSTRFLGDLAKKHGLYLVAGLVERDGTTLHNTSVLIGRDGALVGKYRKVCLPREEIDAGLTPGKTYPVFDTDFGRVGMMICWDLHYPEVARELAARGAEVILLPIWGGNETLAKARAIENQVFLVASGYDFKTAIFDQAGDFLAETTDDPAVLVTEVDLNARRIWPWLGDWKSRIWREGPARSEPEVIATHEKRDSHP
jgi:predicted amidohydrolase